MQPTANVKLQNHAGHMGKNIHHHDSQVRSVTSSQIHQKYAQNKKRNSKKTIYKASKWQSLNKKHILIVSGLLAVMFSGAVAGLC